MVTTNQQIPSTTPHRRCFECRRRIDGEGRYCSWCKWVNAYYGRQARHFADDSARVIYRIIPK